MQLSALFPLLALLLPLAQAHVHDGGAAARRQLSKHSQHIRAHDIVVENISRRDALAAENPKAVNRKVKRGANGCRVRGQNVTLSSAQPSSTSAAYIAPSSAVPASSSSTTTTTTSTSDSWAAPSSAAPAAASSSAASTSSSSSSSNASGNGALTPNGIKAGASGTDTLSAFGSHISWFWNYGPTSDTDDTSHIFMPTLWGDGGTGDQDSQRVSDFKAISWTPQYIQGFYEPDCSPPMSSAIDPSVAAPLWNELIVPWRSKGSLLVSPGMCKQADEDWLTPFLNAAGQENIWDITSIHTNKNNIDGVKKDIDHYWNTYGKPIWVTEFACVDDSNGFTPCTDQGEINDFINQVVDLFESDSRIYAYSMSEGEGLGDVWPPWSNGQLTESGQTYLNAISKYH